MLNHTRILFLFALVACGNDKSNDHPRPSLGACVYTDKRTNKPTICFENSTPAECTDLNPELTHRYVDDTTCASHGMPKQCPTVAGGPKIPSYARFASCPH